MSAYLTDQIHGLSHDEQVVITVQRWQNTLVVFRNGRLVGRTTRPVTVAAEFAAAVATLTPTRLTEEQARARLADLDIAAQHCQAATCGEQLPVGGHRCPRCGMFPARHAAGAMSGATRRGVVTITFDR